MENDEKFSEFIKKINRTYSSKQEKGITKKIKKVIEKYYGKKVISSFLNYNNFWKDNKNELWNIIRK